MKQIPSLESQPLSKSFLPWLPLFKMQEFDTKGRQMILLHRFIEANRKDLDAQEFCSRLFKDPYRKAKIVFYLTNNNITSRIKDTNGIVLTIFHGFLLKFNFLKKKQPLPEEFTQMLMMLKNKDITISITDIISYLQRHNLLTCQIERILYNFQNLHINQWKTANLFKSIGEKYINNDNTTPTGYGYLKINNSDSELTCSGQKEGDDILLNSIYITDNMSRKQPCNKKRQIPESGVEDDLTEAECNATACHVNLAESRQAIHSAVVNGFENAKSTMPLLRELGKIYGAHAGLAAKLAARFPSVHNHVMQKLKDRYNESAILNWQVTTMTANTFDTLIPVLQQIYKRLPPPDKFLSRILNNPFESISIKNIDLEAITIIGDAIQIPPMKIAKLIGNFREGGVIPVSFEHAYCLIAAAMLLDNLKTLNFLADDNENGLTLAHNIGITKNPLSRYRGFLLKLVNCLDSYTEDKIRELSGIGQRSISKTSKLIAYGIIFARAMRNWNIFNTKSEESNLNAIIANDTLKFILKSKVVYMAQIPLDPLIPKQQLY